jgi:hypothetical protein
MLKLERKAFGNEIRFTWEKPNRGYLRKTALLALAIHLAFFCLVSVEVAEPILEIAPISPIGVEAVNIEREPIAQEAAIPSWLQIPYPVSP